MKNNYEFNKYNKVFNYISILISVISIVFLLFKGVNFGFEIPNTNWKMKEDLIVKLDITNPS